MTWVARQQVQIPAPQPNPPALTLLDAAGGFPSVSDMLEWVPNADGGSRLMTDVTAEAIARMTSVNQLQGGDKGAYKQGNHWGAGFQWFPENHSAANVFDVFGTVLDIPPLPVPVGVVATEHITGGTLTAASSPYDYYVTAVNANGETTVSTVAAATIASGIAGSVTLTWDAVEPSSDLTITYNVYGRKSGSIGLLATGVTALTWTDTGTPSPGAAPPTSNTTGGETDFVNIPVRGYYPFMVQVADSCSSFGFEKHDWNGRATRLLKRATPSAIGNEFWTGIEAQATGNGNDYLTQESTNTDLTPMTVPSATRGIQILEDYARQLGFGGQAMLHMVAEVAPNYLYTRRIGKQMFTVFDNLVVPDPGYTGSAPGGAAASTGTTWIYVTDLVNCRVDVANPMVVLPDNFAQALDRGLAGEPNTITFRAQWAAAAFFDGFVHASCQVNLST